MTPREAATIACLAVAVAGFALATVGLFRLPDAFARAHATSKGDTLGTLFAAAAVGLAVGVDDATAKLVVLVVFVFVTTPTATHAIVHAADVEGYEPWTRASVDGDDPATPTRTEGDGE